MILVSRILGFSKRADVDARDNPFQPARFILACRPTHADCRSANVPPLVARLILVCFPCRRMNVRRKRRKWSGSHVYNGLHPVLSHQPKHPFKTTARPCLSRNVHLHSLHGSTPGIMIEFFFALPNSKQSTLTSSATRILSAPPKSKPLQANIFPPIRRPRQTPYVIVIVILFLLYLLHFHHGLGVERTPPTPLGYAVAGGRQVRRSSVSWGRQGMATLLPSVGQKAEHPIYEFMERAEERWRNLLASQSTTLTAAVDEYKRRYQLPPPAGFEYWFAFCKTRGIRIIDDYDQLMKDILPHHALVPAVFLARSQALDGKEFTYTLRIDQEEVKITGDRSGPKHFRPHEQRKLIDGFRHALPPGFRLNITASDHDISGEVLGKDQRQRAMELVRAGQCELRSSLDAGGR